MTSPTGPGPEELERELAEVAAAAERDELIATVDVALPVGARLRAALTGGNVLVTVLAFVLAFVIGGVILALSDAQVREALSYFTGRPGDTLAAVRDVVGGSYSALLRGALGSTRALSETAIAATPLILTGLAVAVPLRAGMFNIGGEGQMMAGGLVGGLVGFSLTGLPLIIHLPLAVCAAIAGGLAWGLIPGLLKARTGAHEVITTIMLNNIARLLTIWILTTTLYRAPGRTDPISRTVEVSAQLPRLGGYRIHLGLMLALLAGVAIWWLLERSSAGFEINAVGLNPEAATGAGMSTGRVIIGAMGIGGILAGLAGGGQVLGVSHRITAGFTAGLGFDGITVALLGRGGVGGTVAAGFLFGGLRAGGRAMQASTGTSLDLVVVLQALVIIFVATPALVRALFRVKGTVRESGQVAESWGQ